MKTEKTIIKNKNDKREIEKKLKKKGTQYRQIHQLKTKEGIERKRKEEK